MNKTELPVIDGEEKTVYQLLVKSKLHIDQIALESGVNFSTLSSILLKLELKGIVKSLPGNYYETV